MKESKISRRRFVKSAADAKTLAGISDCGADPRGGMKRLGYVSTNEKLNIACIG